MSFYVTVYSDASRNAFANNRAANFTTRLNKQIILNGEYNVAVASIIKYRREKAEDPIVLSREKHDVETVTTTPAPDKVCASIPQTFPAFPMTNLDKERLNKARLRYIKDTTPIIFINSSSGNKIELELVKNGSVVKALTHNFRFTEEAYLTEEMLKQITFSHTFTDNGSAIIVSYADMKLKITVTPPITPIESTTAKNAKNTTPAITPTYGVRFWPQDHLKDYLFSEAKSDNVKISETLNVGHSSGKYADLRLTDKYDFIMECEIDSLYKYDGFVGPEENDVRMTFFMKHSYSLKDLLTGYGMTDKYFMNSFEKFRLNPRPKYQKGKNVMLWLSKAVHENLTMPEFMRVNDGHTMEIRIDDPALHKKLRWKADFEIRYKTELQDLTQWVDYVNKQVNLQWPYILKFTLQDDLKLRIDYSEHVKLTLPYVLNNYDIACVENAEQWPITIYYQPSEGLEKIKKATFAKRSDDAEKQGVAIKKACDTETGQNLTFNMKNGDGVVVSIDKNLEVVIPIELAQQFKIPTLLKYTPPSDKAITSLQVKHPVWIACDLVDAMLVGEAALKLLTPSPLDMNYHDIVSRQYVPVNSCRFSEITLSCYSDITNMTPYEGSEDVMVVLHFIPRYKRLRTFTDNDTIDSYKKFCCQYG